MIAAQLLLTADFMSRKAIMHRDLKPENVLLNSKKEGVFDIRIADFGFAMVDTGDQRSRHDKKTACGTPGYVDPAVLAGKGSSFKSDIFSIGSIVFSILTLRNLISGNNYSEIIDKNKKFTLEKINFRMKDCSVEGRDLTKWLLKREPSDRPTASEALSHPWFSGERLPLKVSLHYNIAVTENKSRDASPMRSHDVCHYVDYAQSKMQASPISGKPQTAQAFGPMEFHFRQSHRA